MNNFFPDFPKVKTWFSNARRKVKHRSHGGKTQMGDSKADQKMSLPMANKPQLYLRPNIAAAVDNGLLHRFIC